MRLLSVTIASIAVGDVGLPVRQPEARLMEGGPRKCKSSPQRERRCLYRGLTERSLLVSYQQERELTVMRPRRSVRLRGGDTNDHCNLEPIALHNNRANRCRDVGWIVRLPEARLKKGGPPKVQEQPPKKN
ncbi:hypothetical protein ElyMa_003592100 [Elysia marginata]|uniref:Uncharacterized protein n=1 Tax=Elysia marginata TaxID=1093978 RepID=A0AAV4EQ71_9GAST|nr:hypothetical protein ElyMa_003592100 [Elysia marginata]